MPWEDELREYPEQWKILEYSREVLHRDTSGVITRMSLEEAYRNERFLEAVRHTQREASRRHQLNAYEYLMGNQIISIKQDGRYCANCGREVGRHYFNHGLVALCKEHAPAEKDILPSPIEKTLEQAKRMHFKKDFSHLSLSDADCLEMGIEVKQDYGMRPNANDAYESFSKTMGRLIETIIIEKRNNFTQRKKNGLHLLGSIG